MLYILGRGAARPLTLSHCPNHEVLTNVSDRNPHTCVKFALSQLNRIILLKGIDPLRSISPYRRVMTLSKNLALLSECEPPILVMTQIGLPDTTSELFCKPFCGNLMRGNLSMQSDRTRYWKFVVAHFPCDSRRLCKGLFIRITEKALVDSTLYLELCEIIFAPWCYEESYSSIRLWTVFPGNDASWASWHNRQATLSTGLWKAGSGKRPHVVISQIIRTLWSNSGVFSVRLAPPLQRNIHPYHP